MLGEYESKPRDWRVVLQATFDELVGNANRWPTGSATAAAAASTRLTDQTPCTADPQQRDGKLTGFVQAGLGDGRVNRFGGYLGVGLTAVGVIDGRAADELGLESGVRTQWFTLHRARNSMQGLPVTKAEKTIELTYLIRSVRWLALQPDLQYVITPNTTPTIPNALAFQLRLEMTF